MKLYLGCAMPPFHEQHYKLFPDLDEWTWVDKFVNHPKIQNWNAETLYEVSDKTVDTIYASHLLEHFAHPRLVEILKQWNRKLKDGGEVVINVPDMRWIAEQILNYTNGMPVSSNHYYEWEGEHGIQQIIYGSHAHEGEGHHSGFTQDSLIGLLGKAGFKEIEVERTFDAHDMGVLIARAKA